MMCPKSHSKNERGRIQAWRASFCFCPPGVSGPPQSIGAPFSCDPSLPHNPRWLVQEWVLETSRAKRGPGVDKVCTLSAGVAELAGWAPGAGGHLALWGGPPETGTSTEDSRAPHAERPVPDATAEPPEVSSTLSFSVLGANKYPTWLKPARVRFLSLSTRAILAGVINVRDQMIPENDRPEVGVGVAALEKGLPAGKIRRGRQPIWR